MLQKTFPHALQWCYEAEAIVNFILRHFQAPLDQPTFLVAHPNSARHFGQRVTRVSSSQTGFRVLMASNKRGMFLFRGL